MIKILSPHTSNHSHSTTTTLKTAEILSKYRPIAPKPGTTQANDDNDSSSSSYMSHKISQSPYLRHLWPQLQARPTRTRKRGRGGMGPTSHLSLKRPKSLPGSATITPTSTTPTQRVFGHIKTLSFQAFSHAGLPNVGGSPALMTLPLLQCAPLSSKCMETEIKGNGFIDLNKSVEVIQERDFLRQLQEPITPTTTTAATRVIAPQPIRPSSSRINVTCISPLSNPFLPSQTSKKSPQEVEEEVESDVLPAIISDSNNRVRLVNSAYKEMMGQPECSWLESMVRGKRICGEVMIHFCNSKIPENKSFSCWAKIEWVIKGKEEIVQAFCDVMKLDCGSKDYVFTWRFHTTNK